MTEAQLAGALQQAGFAPDPDLPLRELNARPAGQLRTTGAPVIYEGGFVFKGV
jgi:hypothetical protein